MDIFNEEDLLAIANDGGSSSSCADNNSIDESIAASDELSGGDAVSDDVYKQREVTEPPAVRDVAAKEEDSDDEDGGLLETWFTDLKNPDVLQDESLKSTGREESDVDVCATAHPDNDLAVGNEGNSTGGASEYVCDNTAHCNSRGRAMQLGSSVYDWISKYNSSKRRKASYGDIDSARIIGIEKDLNANEALPRSIVIDIHETAEKNTSKRTEIAHKNRAIISAAGVDATTDSKRFQGDATTCSPYDRRNTKTMVDCVAIYDHERKCYTLETVDMNVTRLQPYSENNDVTSQDLKQNSEAAIDNDVALSKESTQKILDPRTLAKQAEAQIKKLKRKSVGKESHHGTKTKKSADT